MLMVTGYLGGLEFEKVPANRTLQQPASREAADTTITPK
jgi:hypothetical protein